MIRYRALAMLLLAGGCNVPASRKSEIPAALRDSLPGSNLTLWAYPVSDTVRRGGAVRLVVLLRAADDPVSVLDFPESYTFVITGPKGDTLRSDAGPYEAGLYRDETHLTVPRQGFAGHVVDLSCVVPQYGGHGIREKPCVFKYSFAEAGTYLIVARFRSSSPDSSGRNPAIVDLRATPITVVVK